MAGSSSRIVHNYDDSKDNQEGEGVEETIEVPVKLEEYFAKEGEVHYPPLRVSDLVHQLKENDNRITRIDNKLLHLRFQSVSILSIPIKKNADKSYTSTVIINLR